ncbi:dTDP-4-dehydrorhamnose 3,5-epimerase [Monaibacterium marinum]|uniref:dTDP-4-dehydrorhamnose 3,5-epimerase n=2 Tax=Pontivivens marinum TaxID=1690039 RepID=A0A2C9CYP8_9RHOB|nr:dTDP-4-dehydrorhamnose 3,5-epimerase family protein [Monaibacterium marinum]SOH95589.1 dTDP-4-dehydrorhamnose 3,5-epimerase [Monaibacterium marinum]
MQLRGTPLAGLYEIDATPQSDARGSFARLHCPDAFAEAGIAGFDPLQTSLSRNVRAGTLRGLHWQNPPYAESKLVRCVRGAIWDVAVDLRHGSPTYLHWHGVVLDATALNAFFVPEGFAHGFITLTDDADVMYQIGRMFTPGKGQGARWNDPAFGIKWPITPKVLSERDATYPDFAD